NTAATTWSIHKFATSNGAATANWRTNSNTTNLSTSINCVNCMAAIGESLGVDTKNNVFLIINTTAAGTVAPISVSYGGSANVTARSRVVSDGNTFFYVLASVTATRLKQISIGGTIGAVNSNAVDAAKDICYDNSTTSLFAAMATNPSVKQV